MPEDFKFGSLETPPGVSQYGSSPTGLLILLNNILKVAIFIGGLFALTNFILSAIQYIGSSGKPETIEKASSRIWMSFLGLLVIAGSIGMAAIVGLIFYGNASAILSPVIPEP